MTGKNSKIEEIYKNLSRQDKEGIMEFLKCTLFNQSDIVLSIHHYLSEHLCKDNDLNKPELYKAVFNKNEKYSDVKLRVFITKLTKLIEKYLIVKSIDSYPLAELSILNQYYRKNHLHKNYTVFFNSKSEVNFDSYEEYLMYEYAFSMRKLDYISQEFNSDSDRIRKHFDEVLIAQQKLSFFQTLKTQCDFLSFTQRYKSDRDNSYEENIINQLIATRDEQDVVFKGYILVYLLSKEPLEESFLQLKDIVLSEEIKYETNYRALITHSQNYCIRFINSGKSEYLTHLFDIYSLSLKFFKNPGDLNTANFRNILNCALQLGHIEWAEKFVENYYTKVNESEQENTYNFNYARIYFEKQDYKTAMRQLLKVSYEDSFYASTGRILLIKCYYELNDELPLLSSCGSLSQFLHRNKEFTKQRVENNLHFIKYVKTLQNNRLSGTKDYFRKLKLKVSDSTVVQKEWLLKKIEELS